MLFYLGKTSLPGKERCLLDAAPLYIVEPILSSTNEILHEYKKAWFYCKT